MLRALLLLAVSLSFVVAPGAGRSAELRHHLTVGAGYEARINGGFGGHGFGMAAYDLEGLPAGAHLGLSYNTDTARVAFDRVRFADGWLETGFRAAYEFKFAGLLMDYYRRGEKDSERGIEGSYLAFEAYLKANLPRDNYLELNVGVRRWWFARLGGTAPSYVLPNETWVFEPRLRYTFWRLVDDPSLREASRPFPRVRGVALGLELGLDFRSQGGAWGARDPATFQPADLRNPGKSLVLFARQWLRAGWQLHDRVRLQVAEWASYGYQEDDLSRVRLGGLNPWVVPIAGVPWAGIVSGRFVGAEISAHVRVWGELEMGVLAAGVGLEDPNREGDGGWGFVGGVGAFADLRFGDFQIDVRGGWTPSLSTGSRGRWGIYGGAGYHHEF